MSDPAPRPVVINPGSAASEPSEDAAVSVRVAIDRATTDCRNLEQRVVRLSPGAHHDTLHADCEEIAYVVAGTGTASIEGQQLPLGAGTALLVPEDTACGVTCTGDEPLVLLSVLAPQPGSATGPPAAEHTAAPTFAIDAAEQETIPAGDDEERGLMDRHFKLLMDPSRGARFVTQFVGFIERSRAPQHTHTYEEVIYILGGRGTVHLSDGSQHIGPGSSVYLPAGAPHCLENAEDEPLTLVGVFCPAGSPTARRPATSTS